MVKVIDDACRRQTIGRKSALWYLRPASDIKEVCCVEIELGPPLPSILRVASRLVKARPDACSGWEPIKVDRVCITSESL